MAEIDLSSFRGTVRLNAGPGSTSTANSVVATCTITSTDLGKNHNGVGSFGINFESDGAVKINWNEATAAGGVLELSGWGGSVTLPTGFNADLDAWSASINQDSVVFGTFSSRWKKSKQGTGQLTGNATGVLQYRAANTQPTPNV